MRIYEDICRPPSPPAEPLHQHRHHPAGPGTHRRDPLTLASHNAPAHYIRTSHLVVLELLPYG